VTTSPVLLEVLRGGRVESRHRGAIAVVDADGRLVLALGSVERPVFPRSAVKALQALPLIESGAADRFGLTDSEIALACASHPGEPAHVAGVLSMLAKAGQGARRLECGSHWPLSETAARALAASDGHPTPLHNNCSGKHAGFVCLACARGHDPAGYSRPDHAAMHEVTAVLAAVTGERLTSADCAIDGCSVPTYAIPLRSLALGMARFGSGNGLTPERAEAAARLRRAVAAHPFMVGVAGRADTVLTALLGARVYLKGGAEGVHCMALPELGLGVAIKCDDGAGRASDALAARLVRRFLPLSETVMQAVERLAEPRTTNWNGIDVGSLRAAGPLAG
jgi:L-asparaginase II